MPELEILKSMHCRPTSVSNYPTPKCFETHLRVVLSTILAASAVKSDELMAKHVATWRNGSRDLDVPRLSVLDQVIGCPRAWGSGAVNQTGLLDLEEVERARSGGGAAFGALGQVVHDWAVMAVWPGVPGDLYRGSCSDCDLSSACRGGLVAGDVVGAEQVGIDEAIVLVQSVPAGPLGFDAAGSISQRTLFTYEKKAAAARRMTDSSTTPRSVSRVAHVLVKVWRIYWVVHTAVGLSVGNDSRNISVCADQSCSNGPEADNGGERLHREKRRIGKESCSWSFVVLVAIVGVCCRRFCSYDGEPLLHIHPAILMSRSLTLTRLNAEISFQRIYSC